MLTTLTNFLTLYSQVCNLSSVADDPNFDTVSLSPGDNMNQYHPKLWYLLQQYLGYAF